MRFVQQPSGWREFALFSALCCISSLVDGQVVAQVTDKDLIKALEATWEAQRSEIVTACIRYRSVSSGSSGVQPFTPQQVREIVEPLAEQPDDLKSVVLKLHRSERRKQLAVLEVPWSIKEFYAEDLKTREDWHATSGTNTQVFDGEQVVITRPANGQVDLHAAGQSRLARTKIGEFRFIPKIHGGREVVDGRDGQIVLRTTPRGKANRHLIEELVIDEATALVKRKSIHDDKGQIKDEILQYGFVTHPGGIVFPTIIVKTKYRDGSLDHLVICMIEDARFNGDLPADVFAVSVPAGTNVWDRRRDRNDPVFVKTGTEEPDIVEYVNSTTGVSAAAHRNHMRWLLVVISVCLLFAILFLARCRRKSAAKI
ncbi:MAG: hypothetical protein JW818_02165 [Pirellulales bacterium]|nr:hypothetical protein [Pirellulales bacterium]